jgi:hypothetical protein
MGLTTILYDDRAAAQVPAERAGDHLWLSPSDFDTATGWKLATEGLCRGDACVRVDGAWRDAGGRVDLAAFARHMGQPAIHETAPDTWAFGESASVRRDALMSGLAPDFTLPDLDGKLHSLADFRGKKVFLFSWGSY